MPSELSRRDLLAAAATTVGAASMPSTASPQSAPPSRATAERLARTRPFRVEMPQAILDRVRDRLGGVNWPRTASGTGWQYGVDAAWFRSLVDHWRSGYDWRSREAELNRREHRMAEVGGKRVHFVFEAGSGRAPKPILLLHGWPYTFAGLLPLADRLAHPERFGSDPRNGFDVVVPSLPGFVFSDPPDDHPRGLRLIAGNLHRLMTETLGYERYIAHGGDFGAVIADWLAIDQPASLMGIQLHMVAFRHAGASYGSGETGVADPAPEEVAFARSEVDHMERESAYFRLQLTRPETIAYAMADSPVGQAAYILDKWQKWTDTSVRRFEDVYPRDVLLDNVMLYLVTDSFPTSIWPYAGFATEPFGLTPGQTVDVPAGYSLFDDPLLPRAPRRFVERSHTRVVQWRDHAGGGHFPFLQATDTLAADIRAFGHLVS